ncbi:hypothetical protein HKCCE4037_17970 [Rhodobacterales bacterium HKCCE4037]|nr:hypothetical protein [Rhodobacterales bacterium HKCCE4037]
MKAWLAAPLATLAPLALAACVTPQVYVTEIGPLRVEADPDVAIYTPVTLPDGVEIEPTPILGGLVVRTLNGQVVPFEARAAALEALEAHCFAYDPATVPLFFGWRNVGDESLWSAAGCDLPGAA